MDTNTFFRSKTWAYIAIGIFCLLGIFAFVSMKFNPLGLAPLTMLETALIPMAVWIGVIFIIRLIYPFSAERKLEMKQQSASPRSQAWLGIVLIASDIFYFLLLAPRREGTTIAGHLIVDAIIAIWVLRTYRKAS